ncbi:unnamed protein product [Protopolystoma xenopodis]|uniref:Uncharacterized protein n=1 Tax=Protopolystoma xenopodis TaxID=117903 RepID=A0A3S5B406_9PLAT|nr:unnamed protein product [Protopolystoma xenopodis]
MAKHQHLLDPSLEASKHVTLGLSETPDALPGLEFFQLRRYDFIANIWNPERSRELIYSRGCFLRAKIWMQP